jgi:hypothetical protein
LELGIQWDIHALALAGEGGRGAWPVRASGFPPASEGGRGVNPDASKLAYWGKKSDTWKPVKEEPSLEAISPAPLQPPFVWHASAW